MASNNVVKRKQKNRDRNSSRPIPWWKRVKVSIGKFKIWTGETLKGIRVWWEW